MLEVHRHVISGGFCCRFNLVVISIFFLSGTFESYYAEYPLPHLVPMLSSHHCLIRGPIKRPPSSDLNRITSPAKRSAPNETLNMGTTKDTVTVQGEDDNCQESSRGDEEKLKKRVSHL